LTLKAKSAKTEDGNADPKPPKLPPESNVGWMVFEGIGKNPFRIQHASLVESGKG
jgi:hypothetical protein